MNDFAAFLRDMGLEPGNIVADGKIHRCRTESKPKKKNGRYFLSIDGRFGWGMDWAQHESPVTWRPDGPAGLPEPIDPAVMKRRMEADRRKRAKATECAREFYAKCSVLVGGHGYLTSHGLDMAGCRGLKVDGSGWLVVPMLRGGNLVSVQRIAPDGDKRFWPGAPTQGAMYVVERAHSSMTVLCEGLATGLAIFAAVPTARVVVSFTAGNMPKVAAKLPRRGMVCVAADNDHGTEAKTGKNPGVLAGEEASRILGCEIAVPGGITGTDWCDLRQERAEAIRSRAMYGRRKPTEGDVARTVDGEIAAAMMRAARFLYPAAG